MRFRPATTCPTALSEIRSDVALDASVERAIRLQLMQDGRFGVHGRFKAEGAVNKWGSADNMELAAIRISDQAFENIDPAVSLSPHQSPLHVALEASDGRLFGYRACSKLNAPDSCTGIIINDGRGRGWMCEVVPSAPDRDFFSDRAATFTGEGPMREVSLLTAPAVGLLCMGKGMPDRLDALGVFGGNLQLENGIIAGTDGLPIRRVTPDHAHLMPGLARMTQRVDAILEREDAITRAVAPHITPAALDSLFAIKEFPNPSALFPAYESADRKSFSDRLLMLTRDIAFSLRDAGLCAPCPNDGPHQVRGLKAWNALLAGDLDGEPASFKDEKFWLHHQITSAPLFQAVQSALVSVSVDIDMSNRPPVKIGQQPDREATYPLTEEQYRAGLVTASRALGDLLRREEPPPFSLDLRSNLKADLRLHLAGSILTPVLAMLENGRTLVPLPVIDDPAPVRHLELTLPSSRLAVADWFRIPGFTEGIEKLCDGDNFSINQASGLDDRAQAYCERLGLAIVQVGNSSPVARQDTPGVWRVGYVDEDHEAFWNEGGKPDDYERSDLYMPEPAWRTCTDLWANTFAAPEVITDILMASGQYQERAEADATVAAYCTKEYGASLNHLGIETLHLYLPTGYGEQRDLFPKLFRAEGLEYPEWREDLYVLSAEPLQVDPSLLEKNTWAEGRIDPALSARIETEPDDTLSPSF